jgi:hypothetical protein
MINFMLDPKGDMPWNEDALAQDVLHLNTPKVKFIFLKYLLKKEELFRIFNEH